MGIKNLHTHLINFVSRPNTQIALCCGKTRFLEVEGIDDDSVIRVALDISGWIQKAIFGFSGILMDAKQMTNHGRATAPANSEWAHEEDQGRIREFTKKVLEYVMDKLRRLRVESGVRVLVVIDGASPPAKKEESNQRKRRRDEANSMFNNIHARIEDRVGAQHRAGCSKGTYEQIVCEMIKLLRKEDFHYIIAPYEADAELAFLSRNNLVDLIVTEDSDLVPLGAGNIMFKFQHETQAGRLLRRRDLFSTSNARVNLFGFSDAMIAVLCIAVGCDYSPNLKNIGIVSARDIVYEAFRKRATSKNYTRASSLSPLERVFDGLFQKTSMKLSENDKADYKLTFLHSLIMFQHPVVFDPVSGKCVYLTNPFSEENIDEDLSLYEPYNNIRTSKYKLQQIVGVLHHSTMSKHIASGWIHPHTFDLRFPIEDTPLSPVNYVNDSIRTKEVQPKEFQYNQESICNHTYGNTSNANGRGKLLLQLASQDSTASLPSKFQPSQHVLTQHSFSTSGTPNSDKQSTVSQPIKLSSLSSSLSPKNRSQISSQSFTQQSKISPILSPLYNHPNRGAPEESNDYPRETTGSENLSPNDLEVDLPSTQAWVI